MLEVDCSTNSIAWGRCLRVKVFLNVTKPLVRGTKVEFDGNVSIVIFLYEKLCEFCFICGKLDHVEKDCPCVFSNESDVVREMR